MLKSRTLEILSASKEAGWVMEPEAKSIFALEGLPVPKFTWARDREAALAFAHEIGYPVAMKVVSPRVLHKSDVSGVAVNVAGDEDLEAVFSRFSLMDGFQGVVVEEMLSGVELIFGATIDYQFGPVVLLGFGGTSVEIYKDTALRLAPLSAEEALSMVKQLRAYPLLEGYRGSEPVNVEELTRVLVRFSEIVAEMGESIESVDLNPVMCKGNRCIIADGRIMLAKKRTE